MPGVLPLLQNTTVLSVRFYPLASDSIHSPEPPTNAANVGDGQTPGPHQVVFFNDSQSPPTVCPGEPSCNCRRYWTLTRRQTNLHFSLTTSAPSQSIPTNS